MSDPRSAQGAPPPALAPSLRPAAAVARLSALDAWRGGVPWLAAAAAAGLALAVARLDAAEAADRTRLALSLVVGVPAALAALLAGILPALWLRRDLEQRQALMLFSKPLGAGGYVLGRMLGLIAVLAAAGLAVAAIGLAAVQAFGLASPWQPALRVQPPAAWSRLTALGEERAVRPDAEAVGLSEPAAGDGVRWSFADLPAAGADLLIKAEVRHQRVELSQTTCAVQVAAWPGGDLRAVPRVLALSPASPYGASDAGADRVRLRSREAQRRGLDSDYARLRIPPEAISADGRAEIRLVRLDPEATATFDIASGAFAATPGGPLAWQTAQAVLIGLAPAAVVGAVALLVAAVASLPVALLGALTAFVAGSAVWTMREILSWGGSALPVQRLLELGLVALPDFAPAGLAAEVAAGRALGPAQWLAGWGALGLWTLGAAGAAWWILRRGDR